MKTWVCPKCKVTVMSGKDDPPGCPCCGYKGEKKRKLHEKWEDGKKITHIDKYRLKPALKAILEGE